MEQLSVLRTIEDAVFEIANWPWDMARLAWMSLRPWKVQAYVKAEWIKEPDKRFKDTMSPIMFWLILVVLPCFLLLDHHLQQATILHSSLQIIANQAWPVRFSIFSFFMACWPACCSRAIVKYLPIEQDNSTMKRLFNTFCIAAAPSAFLLLTVLILATIFHEQARAINGKIASAYIVVCVLTQIIIAFNEIPRKKLWFFDVLQCFSIWSLLHGLSLVIIGILVMVLSLPGGDIHFPTTIPTQVVTP